jgi:hypothetical protein
MLTTAETFGAKRAKLEQNPPSISGVRTITSPIAVTPAATDMYAAINRYRKHPVSRLTAY